MRPFRFRAQAALMLRQREDDEATRAHAQAERRLRLARAALDEADGRLAGARAMTVPLGGAPEASGDSQWYRFWMVRLQHERAVLAAAVVDREAEVERARVARQLTYRRRKALERFREKVASAYAREAEAVEQRALDAIGTLRHSSARRAT